MAKKFICVAIGVLALSAAYHLGAARTEAQPGTGTPSILGLAGDVVWDGAGQAWEIESATQWERRSQWDTPVPPTDVLFIQTRGSGFIGYFADLAAANGDVWGFNSNTPAPHWTYRGQVPQIPVSLGANSFGTIKGKFK